MASCKFPLVHYWVKHCTHSILSVMYPYAHTSPQKMYIFYYFANLVGEMRCLIILVFTSLILVKLYMFHFINGYCYFFFKFSVYVLWVCEWVYVYVCVYLLDIKNNWQIFWKNHSHSICFHFLNVSFFLKQPYWCFTYNNLIYFKNIIC